MAADVPIGHCKLSVSGVHVGSKKSSLKLPWHPAFWVLDLDENRNMSRDRCRIFMTGKHSKEASSKSREFPPRSRYRTTNSSWSFVKTYTELYIRKPSCKTSVQCKEECASKKLKSMTLSRPIGEEVSAAVGSTKGMSQSEAIQQQSSEEESAVRYRSDSRKTDRIMITQGRLHRSPFLAIATGYIGSQWLEESSSECVDCKYLSVSHSRSARDGKTARRL